MKALAAAFLAGVVFALGLGISGMTNPEKVLGFLDVAGTWDPSLAFVMVGAIAVHAAAARWARGAPRPLWSDCFVVSTRREVDVPLLAGAALFGFGWGTAGYCPGPAIVDCVAPSAGLVTFVVAMLAGTLAFRLPDLFVRARSLPSPSPPPGASSGPSTVHRAQPS